MAGFSKRFEVLLGPAQYRKLRETGAARGLSVGALIRDAIDLTYPERKLGSGVEDRLEAVAAMAGLSLPVAEWDVMERESVK